MIYTTHGVVNSFEKEKFCHSGFLDRELFINHLSNREEKYVSLEEALEQKGDALTIDDSLMGGFEAAVLCRELGHEVSLFINPFYIQNRFLYWFCLLNIFLDSDEREEVFWERKKYPLDDFSSKLKFRLELKSAIAKLSPQKSISSLQFIFQQKVNQTILSPFHLTVLTVDDLKKALSLGIEIHNHGWTHCQITAFKNSELEEEIFEAKDWLSTFLGVDSNFYAVPFGKDLPPNRYDFKNCHTWFLAYDKLSYGKIGPRIYNRQPLLLY